MAAGIRLQLNPDTFQRWFAPIELVRADELALTFRVPNSIYQYWIESNYLNLMRSVAMSVLGSHREIKFCATEGGSKSSAFSLDLESVAAPLPISKDEASEETALHGM